MKAWSLEVEVEGVSFGVNLVDVVRVEVVVDNFVADVAVDKTVLAEETVDFGVVVGCLRDELFPFAFALRLLRAGLSSASDISEASSSSSSETAADEGTASDTSSSSSSLDDSGGLKSSSESSSSLK